MAKNTGRGSRYAAHARSVNGHTPFLEARKQGGNFSKTELSMIKRFIKRGYHRWVRGERNFWF